MTVLAAVRLMPRPPEKCEAILEINPSVSALVTRSSGQYEDENILLLVELINQKLSLLDWSLSVKAEIPGNINYHISCCSNSNSGLTCDP